MYLIYLVLSVIFFIYCSFKLRQSEGKDRRNDRLVRLHGDGSFLSSIVNKVMGFVWAVLCLASVLTAFWAYYMHQRPEATIEQKVQKERKVEEQVPEVTQEVNSPAAKSSADLQPHEVQKDQSDNADKPSEGDNK